MLCKPILFIVVLSIVFLSAGNFFTNNKHLKKPLIFKIYPQFSEADKVDRVFEQCNSLHENDGLSLAEVQHEDCQRILNAAGYQPELLHETFKRFDMNADGFVTKAEARIVKG